ncbi:hypothetical protein C361_07067 [Cryptococcus neoformans Tu259-1]|uniref:Importin N-terminal domain-containing protein n=1 Tax=Cryptococcus neoformans Tu259-1 TaxID=1230072 RepID=A0A854Q3Z8_CRYNE|nr:hypothetical protein C353_06946 [Cryptococcus neoformans var. grubii AD1-83a]OXG09883.1 hypothetical protein C361_07067 [Cryptococcus neoformans var. grubii Tu259-1]OXG42593.1 hypothetical protein C354_06925 [Cryptococcus neoformans var. grubii MW-RSA1955]OXG56140.1 hypothetical protein C351_06929 [Cryptococcus neoformans var. grubii c8]OXH00848.1 hypothetical protein C369_07062 [Cryptococcus neoformans var. grubii A5-35-17]OXH02076.1 hypothetical protein C370_07064 [Cryptococcus neoformans
MATDIRVLVHSVVYPTNHEQYSRDQQALSGLFKEPEFLISLQTLAADKTLSHPERLMASLITGREMKTKWRSKAITPEARKPEIRQRLFSFLEEEDFAIARPQLSLLVAVARIEYPKTWQNLPQLFLEPLLSTLLHLANPSSLTPAASTLLINVLWTINALVKEWRTVRITQGAAVMQTLEQLFTEPLRRILDIWGESERNGGGYLPLEEAGRYAFKILARFCQWHWSKAKPMQTEEAILRIQYLVGHSVTHASVIQSNRLRLIATKAPSEKTLKSITKHLRAIGKWWRAMIALDPKGFCKIDGTTAGIGWWWGEVGGVVAGTDGTISNDDSDDSPYPKRFLLLGLLLFKDILPILAADHHDIFTPEFILSAFHLLVDKLLPLTSTDLDALEDEPEEWLIGESTDAEAWAFEFRPCAERVLIALNNACRNVPRENKVIEPAMLKLLSETQLIPPDNLPSVLRHESVYCALGRLSRSMASYGGVNFESLLTGMGSWISQGKPLHRIVKRRVAWLIGEWMSGDEESAKLHIVWQLLLHLLSERGNASDRAVNLTAAVAIKECVDLWELPIDYFLPFLEQTVQELIKLLGEASTLDGKRYVNDTVGVIIERVGDKIMPYLPTLAQSVPALWHGAIGLEGEWLFKASLVVLTTKLVSAAKESSGGLMELVIPLIEESLQPPAKEFFEEDGLILWQTALYNSASPYQPSPETGLIRILPGLLLMLGSNLDLLPKLLSLLDSYLLLDPVGISQAHGQAIASNLATALSTSNGNESAVICILATVSLWTRIAPLPVISSLLLQAGIFHHITTALEDDKASGLILAAYLEILSRIAMNNPNVFLQMVEESAKIQSQDVHKLLEEILDAVWRNFDYVGETRLRKVVAMGVGNLLLTGNQQVMERLDGDFMNIFLDVLGEVQQSEGSLSAQETGLVPWIDNNSTLWTEIENTPEGQRRLSLENNDPAYTVPLKDFILQLLNQASSVGLDLYWAKADAGAKRSLEKFLN